MALIECSECSKEVSDKAGSCPHCGAPISTSDVTLVLCWSCKKEYPENLDACPYCKKGRYVGVDLFKSIGSLLKNGGILVIVIILFIAYYKGCM